MARIRSIKPEAFTSETLAGLSVLARWTFAGLWTYADDDGRGRANAGLIKAAVWPLDDDVTPKHVSAFLDELEDARLVCRYEVDGKSYLHVVNFDEHQHPNRPLPSKLPACTRRAHGGLTASSVSPHPKGSGGDMAAGSTPSEVKGTAKTAATAKTAGQVPLTEDAVSPHGVGTTKPSSIPPTPVSYIGEGVGEGEGTGDGVQPSAGAENHRAAAPELTIPQRSKRITDAYDAAVPMCKWPAVNGVVIRAIKTEQWSDGEILSALLRMANENRSVTIDSLRTELGGLPPPQGTNGRRPSTGDQRVAAIQALKKGPQETAGELPPKTIPGSVE